MELLTWCRLQWDRALAVAAMTAGVVMVLIGWIGVSGTPFVAKQVPYIISGGIGGLVLLVVAATLWLSADLNDEWRALDALDAKVLGVASDQAAVAALEERLRVLELLARLPQGEPTPAPVPTGGVRQRRAPGPRATAS